MASVEVMRHRAIERSRALLEPGETVRRVYFAQGGPNPVFGGLLVAPAALLGRYLLGDQIGPLCFVVSGLVWFLLIGAVTSRRVVLHTDRAMVILAYGRFGGFRPSALVARLPKDTAIPTLTGTWAPVELRSGR